MPTNKILIYSLIFIFAIAFCASFPEAVKHSYLKVKIPFQRKQEEKTIEVERNPFAYKTSKKKKRVVEKKPKLSSITLKSIIGNSKNLSAAISINGGKVIFVNEGDKVNGIKILRIDRNRIVIYEHGKRTIELK